MGPPVTAVGENFEPAVEAFFSAESVTSVEDVATKLGSMWEAASGAMESFGAWLGGVIGEYLQAPGGEYTIGWGIGYIAGMILWEVILGVLTSGAWTTLGPTARAIVKFLDLGGTVFGKAFELLGDLGRYMLKALEPIGAWISSIADDALGAMFKSFDDIANIIIKWADELLGKADEAAGLSDEAAAGAKHTDEVASGAKHTDEVASGADEVADLKRVVIAGEDERLALAASRIQPEGGMMDVVVHADGDTFKVLEGGSWTTMSPEDLARKLQDAGHTDESIRLIACNSGNADGAAAKLSKELGVEVKAPTDTVWIHADGSLTVGPTPDAPSGGWSKSTPDGSTRVVDESAGLTDEAAENLDDAVAVGKKKKETDTPSGDADGSAKPVELTADQVRLADSTGYYIDDNGVVRKAPDDYVGPTPAGMSPNDKAAELGFDRTNYRSHGQPVYKKGNRYISPDVDGHNVSNGWKMADSVRNLGRKNTRMGTYDADLNRIGN